MTPDEYVHTSCYCCWLAGSGGSPPCSWCTNPDNFEDQDDPIADQQESDNDRFNRVMKELGF